MVCHEAGKSKGWCGPMHDPKQRRIWAHRTGHRPGIADGKMLLTGPKQSGKTKFFAYPNLKPTKHKATPRGGFAT
jgi:hypothetical protein